MCFSKINSTDVLLIAAELKLNVKHFIRENESIIIYLS